MTDEQFAKFFYLFKKMAIWITIIGVCQLFQCAYALCHWSRL